MNLPAPKDRGGRPRDPDVDRRIIEAALQVFGLSGWSGFSMEAVARTAGVGKASSTCAGAAKPTSSPKPSPADSPPSLKSTTATSAPTS